MDQWRRLVGVTVSSGGGCGRLRFKEMLTGDGTVTGFSEYGSGWSGFKINLG